MKARKVEPVFDGGRPVHDGEGRVLQVGREHDALVLSRKAPRLEILLQHLFVGLAPATTGLGVATPQAADEAVLELKQGLGRLPLFEGSYRAERKSLCDEVPRRRKGGAHDGVDISVAKGANVAPEKVVGVEWIAIDRVVYKDRLLCPEGVEFGRVAKGLVVERVMGPPLLFVGGPHVEVGKGGVVDDEGLS